MNLGIAGRKAIVCASSRGLGYAVARALGASGTRVVALARTVGGLEDLADEIDAAGGPAPTLVPLSVTDEGGLQRLCLAIDEVYRDRERFAAAMRNDTRADGTLAILDIIRSVACHE